MKYKASCHCGAIALEFEGNIAEVIDCNCSLCRRRGSLLWFMPRSALTLLSAPAAATTYTFNKHHIQHRFCASCGIHPFGEGTDPHGNPMVAINVRCVEDLDLSGLHIQHFDGKSM